MKERASQLVHRRDQEMVRLDRMLEADGMTEASRQIRELRAGFEAFKNVLEQKLDSGELGYQRFRVVLEELFLSSLDNLEKEDMVEELVGKTKAQLVEAKGMMITLYRKSRREKKKPLKS